MNEKRKISTIWYFVAIAAAGLFLVYAGLAIAWIIPMGAEKLDTYFNAPQEIADERFIVEYQETGIGIYHDNVLNVTCYSTGVGLSCIPDGEIGRR